MFVCLWTSQSLAFILDLFNKLAKAKPYIYIYIYILKCSWTIKLDKKQVKLGLVYGYSNKLDLSLKSKLSPGLN